jgi:hypothetical protein
MDHLSHRGRSGPTDVKRDSIAIVGDTRDRINAHQFDIFMRIGLALPRLLNSSHGPAGNGKGLFAQQFGKGPSVGSRHNG